MPLLDNCVLRKDGVFPCLPSDTCLSTYHSPSEQYLSGGVIQIMEIWKMIEIVPLDSSQRLQFENYDQLFDYIIETENLKLLKKRQEHKQSDWSFTTYPPKQVAALYSHSNNPDAEVREAYEEGLSLIEICTGSYAHPNYIVMTPNVDMDYLKRKWCLDFCTYHDLFLRDYSQIYKRKCFINMECSTYII